MIKLEFKNKEKEIEFFKQIPYFNTVENVGISYAVMMKDDLYVAEKEHKMQCFNADPNYEE